MGARRRKAMKGKVPAPRPEPRREIPAKGAAPTDELEFRD